MKQVLQCLENGKTEIVDIPCPCPGPGQVLIRTHTSLVSAGTERMLVEFGRAGWLRRARQHPDKVGAVMAKMKTDGLLATINTVRNKLDKRIPMGYSNVGTILAVGAGVNGLAPGQRVVSNGAHAEIVCVSENLCARVPDAVVDEQAAFVVVGAIALQGIRLAMPTLGEALAVIGLGPIGLLAVQLLRANGCRVLGLDFDQNRLALATRFGADVIDLSGSEDPLGAAQRFSRGRGLDAVIVTASTDSNEPISQAAHMCRKRGRIVLIGTTGLELSRADFYEKELSFQVSCSYGPGRYDPQYEERGHDYPVGFVRWTAQRNFEAVLDMLADDLLDAMPLVSHQFAFEQAPSAYDLILSGAPSLGVLLQYSSTPDTTHISLLADTVLLRDRLVTATAKRTYAYQASPGVETAARGVHVGVIGAGQHAAGVLIPALKTEGAELISLASSGGITAAHVGRRYGFQRATTNPEDIFADDTIRAVVIATRHDSHANLVCEALRAGKHVFVEKPLALSHNELDSIVAAHANATADLVLMVGFNRRFAPLIRRMDELLGGCSDPKAMVMTVNAGAVAPGHWTEDTDKGGGRVVGEACHFIDLLRFLTHCPIVSSNVFVHGGLAGRPHQHDRLSISLLFTDGSIGTIHYFANGHRAYPKERLEVFCGGRVLQMDNFRRLRGWGWSGFSSERLWKQDKGHRMCVRAFLSAAGNGASSSIVPSVSELIEVSRIAVQAADTARGRRE